MRKNLNKVPEVFLTMIDASSKKNFMVASTIEISKEEIIAGNYQHIGITFHNEQISFSTEILPSTVQGRYSKRNQSGHFITRRDLEKVYKTFYYGERPKFGDWSKGSFSLFVTRLVYQKDFIPPKELPLTIELLNEQNGRYIFKVALEELLNRDSPQFQQELLFNLNLLQENIGKCDVYPSDATHEDYMQSLKVGWELLPVGKSEEYYDRIFSGSRRNFSEEQKQVIRDRFDFLTSLTPLRLIKGLSGMKRYFGAKFAEDLVVLENLDYGNAIYVMYSNWEVLSRSSRTELLKKSNRDFDRIKHNGTGWKIQLQTIIDKKLRADDSDQTA